MSFDYGIRISADGVDVLTGADKDMVLTSKLSMLKGAVAGSGVISVPRNGTDTQVVIAHGLGYIPMLQSFWNDRDGDIFDPTDFYQLPLNLYTGDEYLFFALADATNIVLSFNINDFGGGGGNVDIRYAYYIFIDKGKI